MDLKTKMEVLPCGMCEDMISCDNCLFQKEAKELYNEIYNQALEDMANRIKEYSGEHYLYRGGYFGGQTELVFRTEEFLDDVLSELKK